MWLKDYKWIAYATALSVAISLVVTVVVLVAYGVKLGPISSKPDDWGSFGSVLSGAFTLLGSVTTFGTLVFLLVQQRKNDEYQRIQEDDRQEVQKKHDEVILRQLEAQTFEQYLKHREVFFDRLESLESTFEGEVRFTNKDALYQWVFPNNCPTYCSYVVELSATDGKSSGLIKLRESYLSLGRLLTVRPVPESLAYSVLEIMRRIREQLYMSYQGKRFDGDVCFGKTNLGINIYSLAESLEVIVLTVNSIFFYAGNEEFKSYDGAVKECVLRRSVVFSSLDLRLSGTTLGVLKFAPGLAELERIYKLIVESDFLSFYPAKAKLIYVLDRVFSSKQEVEKLADYGFYNSIINELKMPLNVLYSEFEGQEEKQKLLIEYFSALNGASYVAYKKTAATEK